jgi:hypothetical protein
MGGGATRRHHLSKLPRYLAFSPTYRTYSTGGPVVPLDQFPRG